MSEIKLTIIRPFEMGTDKEAADKVLEEASEAREAAQQVRECNYRHDKRCVWCDWKDRKNVPQTCKYWNLADEIADTIQASCNLAARYGIDLQAAMERCEQRNRERGRYGDANTNEVRESSVGDTAIRRWMDSDSRGNNSPTCACDRSGVVDSDGNRDAHYKTTKSPEEMSVDELIEALYLANGYRGNGDGYCEDGSCTKTLGVDWCDTYHTCRNCRKRLLDLLETAYKQEKEGLRCEESYLADEIVKRDKEIEGLKREAKDLIHERDGLRNRLTELSDAGITELHRLLRETVGEAKNITDNARVYIDRQNEGNNERCGNRGIDSGRDSCNCGAERARERVLSEEPPAQEMSEREAVIERLRGIDFAQGNVTLGNIVRAVLGYVPTPWWNMEDRAVLRDKLIELLRTPGWEYCGTCELTEQEQRIARLEKSNDWLTSRCGQLEERVFELGKQVNRAAIIEQGLRNRGMSDMADEFADFHDVTEDAYAAFLALLKVDDGE